MRLLSISIKVFLFTVAYTAILFLILLPLSADDFMMPLMWGMVIHGIIFAIIHHRFRQMTPYLSLSDSWFALRIPIGLAIVSLSSISTIIGFYLLLPEHFKPLLNRMAILAFCDFLITLLHIFNTKKEKREDEEMGTETETDTALLLQTEETEVKTYDDHLAVKDGSKIQVIKVEDITYIEANGDYMMIHTDRKKLIKEETMKNLEAQLDPHLFVRVHRSFIVNVRAIERVERYDKQNQSLVLKNGAAIRASLSGYKRLRQTLGI